MDTQNQLGQVIVDAQNALGTIIVDGENSNGKLIVDAQNSKGKLIVGAQNYITEQHNTLSRWLQKNLCTMFEKDGGTCEVFIGPLEEDQAVLPVELYWPEGQPTLLEDMKSNVEVQLIAMHDTLSSKVQAKLDVHSAEIEARVVNMVESVRKETQEAKEMVRKLMDMFVKEQLVGKNECLSSKVIR